MNPDHIIFLRELLARDFTTFSFKDGRGIPLEEDAIPLKSQQEHTLAHQILADLFSREVLDQQQHGAGLFQTEDGPLLVLEGTTQAALLEMTLPN